MNEKQPQILPLCVRMTALEGIRSGRITSNRSFYEDIPQGLKPIFMGSGYGPAKAVPLLQNNRFVEFSASCKAVPLLQRRSGFCQRSAINQNQLSD